MKWFNYSEFDSPDEPGSGNLMDPDFLEMLDEARSRAGIPFVVTSGYRTDDYNEILRQSGYKTSVNSSHLKGCAADIAYQTPRDCFLIVTALLEAGFDRVGIGNGFVHCDTDWEKPGNVCWCYY